MYNPTRTIKLATVGGSVGRNGIPEAERAQALAARQEQIASGGYGFGARVDALLGPKTSPEVRELVRNGVRATNPRAFMQTIKFSLSGGYSPAEVVAAVKIPVLLISGTADRVSPIETNASVFKKATPGARLEILRDIGHLPHIEASERVNQLLREFFSK
jgi:pimeloyl-ACP methyl ester carboxylesterase